MKNLALELKYKELNIRNYLKKLELAGLNVDKYKDKLSMVISKITSEEEENNSNVLTLKSLDSKVLESISILDIFYDELKKYEIFITISNFTNLLASWNNSDSEGVSIDIINSNIINILDSLKEITSSDYYVIAKIIEAFYKEVYKFLKISLSKYKNNVVYKKIISDKNDTAYIEKFILEELDSITYMNVVKAKNELLGSKGSLVNEKLINLLALGNFDQESIVREIEDIKRKIAKNETRIEKKQEKIDSENVLLNDFSKNIMSVASDLKKRSLCLFGSGFLLLGAMGFNFGLTRSINSTRYTRVDKESFSDGKIKNDSSYETNPRNGLTLIEYEPYKEFFCYERKVNFYYVDELYSSSLDIAALYDDIKNDKVGSRPDDTIKEKVGQLYPKDLYTENNYELVKSTVNSSDYYDKINIIWFIEFLILDSFDMFLSLLMLKKVKLIENNNKYYLDIKPFYKKFKNIMLGNFSVKAKYDALINLKDELRDFTEKNGDNYPKANLRDILDIINLMRDFIDVYYYDNVDRAKYYTKILKRFKKYLNMCNDSDLTKMLLSEIKSLKIKYRKLKEDRLSLTEKKVLVTNLNNELSDLLNNEQDLRSRLTSYLELIKDIPQYKHEYELLKEYLTSGSKKRVLKR